MRTGQAVVRVRGFPDSAAAITAIKQAVRTLLHQELLLCLAHTIIQIKHAGSPYVSLQIRLVPPTERALEAIKPIALPKASVVPEVAPDLPPAAVSPSEPVQAEEAASLIDLDDESLCTLPPPLTFSASTSSSSARTNSAHKLDGATLQIYSPPLQLTTGQAAPLAASELAQFREALANLGDPALLPERHAILALLLMLPKKQRLKCIFHNEYLRVKAMAALAMLTVEPTDLSESLI